MLQVQQVLFVQLLHFFFFSAYMTLALHQWPFFVPDLYRSLQTTDPRRWSAHILTLQWPEQNSVVISFSILNVEVLQVVFLTLLLSFFQNL